MYMTKLIQFHTRGSHPLFKVENQKVANKLLNCKVEDYSTYVQICNIFGATPHFEVVFNNHLKGI